MELSDVIGNKRPLPQDEAEADSPSSKKSRTDSSPSSLTSSQLAQKLSQKNTHQFNMDNSISLLLFEGNRSCRSSELRCKFDALLQNNF